ncbi:MAG: PQQ-dependent sugar dehydrogenase [Nitrococcus sp.]|nr:PQQ-dependent sugar dehydrogenase [Nitrococcus sp.]
MKTMNQIHLAAALLLALSGTALGQVGCDGAGLKLPDGFCATVFAENLGRARHLAVSARGDVYVALRQPVHDSGIASRVIAGIKDMFGLREPVHGGGGIAALRDTNADGRADVVRYFGDVAGSGIAIYDGHLYFGTVTKVVRWSLAGDALVPVGDPQVVVSGMPVQHQHSARSLVINPQGDLFINIGAPSNSCQKQDRQTGSPGIDPCPLLRLHGGIWRFSAEKTGQVFDAAHRYATGIRNAVAMDWNAPMDHLYVIQHGRDDLHRLWPELYTPEQNANLPAEEFLRVDQGDHFGWPYCYYDPFKDKKLLAPEYGGDGSEVGRCARFEDPVLAFPAHWAPNGLLFYYRAAFPNAYSGGAFIAFHGSWNRAPFPEQGYKVVFVAFEDGMPADGDWRVFADGFAGKSFPANTEYRPVGLARDHDGALYVSDDVQGRIWRITYE